MAKGKLSVGLDIGSGSIKGLDQEDKTVIASSVWMVQAPEQSSTER